MLRLNYDQIPDTWHHTCSLLFIDLRLTLIKKSSVIEHGSVICGDNKPF